MVTTEEVHDRPTVDWDRPLFSLGSCTYTHRDVVAAAILRGDWRDLEDGPPAGLACAKRARTTTPPRIDLAKAAEEFRYERNLITAEETEHRLERSGVTFENWTAYLERTLLRQAWADWIRVRWRCGAFNLEETAKEAALCLIHDREPLEDVARRGRSAVRTEEQLLESIDRPLRDLVAERLKQVRWHETV